MRQNSVQGRRLPGYVMAEEREDRPPVIFLVTGACTECEGLGHHHVEATHGRRPFDEVTYPRCGGDGKEPVHEE
ncbi:hypothetical protein IHE61_12950 [Streptomyces sp. GKU 257-1]|nr:hypothetical protein [Streptomyces sp. GKU 257-1]